MAASDVSALDVFHSSSCFGFYRCFKKYYSPQGMPPTDTLVCNHGRWMKQNGLECRQRCWWENVWDALATGHQAVRREAYNISGLAASLASRAAGWVNHGLTQEIVCATGHTASRGRTVAVVTCNNGEWTPVILSCKRELFKQHIFVLLLTPNGVAYPQANVSHTAHRIQPKVTS